VIRCISEQLDVEVHFLTKKKFVDIVRNNPHIHTVHTLGDWSALNKKLQDERFDLIIDLHKNIRSMRIRNQLGVRTLSFKKLNLKKWLMVNLKWNLLPKLHLVDRYFEKLKNIGVYNDGKGLDYYVPKEAEVDLGNMFGRNNVGPFIVFVIGAAHATKRLPADKIEETCSRINFPIVLLGGESEKQEGEAIASRFDSVWNCCGILSINQSASVIKQSAVVITNDTGMMHIAAAYQKFIITVWGNTIPDFGMYPYFAGRESNEIRVETKNLGCRPCSKIGFNECPKGHLKCMNMLSSSDIASSALGVLETIK